MQISPAEHVPASPPHLLAVVEQPNHREHSATPITNRRIVCPEDNATAIEGPQQLIRLSADGSCVTVRTRHAAEQRWTVQRYRCGRSPASDRRAPPVIATRSLLDHLNDHMQPRPAILFSDAPARRAANADDRLNDPNRTGDGYRVTARDPSWPASSVGPPTTSRFRYEPHGGRARTAFVAEMQWLALPALIAPSTRRSLTAESTSTSTAPGRGRTIHCTVMHARNSQDGQSVSDENRRDLRRLGAAGHLQTGDRFGHWHVDVDPEHVFPLGQSAVVAHPHRIELSKGVMQACPSTSPAQSAAFTHPHVR